MAFQQTTALSSTSLCGYLQLLDGTTGQCCIAFRSDGAIVLTSGTVGGTVLATYTGAVTASNTWYTFEFEVVINNTTGSFSVRKNGNTSNDFSATGLNTRPGTNNYANKLQIGTNSSGFNQNIDDLFWRSDASSVAWLGDIRCQTRMPASDIGTPQFSRTSTGAITQTVPTSASNSRAIANNQALFTAITASYSGTVTSVGVVLNAGNSGNMKCAIYADNGAGGPGSLISAATAPITPVPTGTAFFTFSPGVTVTKGVQYRVSYISDTATGNYNTGSVNQNYWGNTPSTYAAFPASSVVASVGVQAAQVSWTYTATPANWQAVSEAQQDGTTSYVYDSTVNDVDLYGVASILSTPITTVAVTTRAYMQKSDAGSRTAAVQIKSGSTTVASPTMVLSPSGFQWTWRMDLVDPNTSAAWTAAAVNAAQIGPTIIS